MLKHEIFSISSLSIPPRMPRSPKKHPTLNKSKKTFIPHFRVGMNVKEPIFAKYHKIRGKGLLLYLVNSMFQSFLVSFVLKFFSLALKLVLVICQVARQLQTEFGPCNNANKQLNALFPLSQE